jgi:hypothetical protein
MPSMISRANLILLAAAASLLGCGSSSPSGGGNAAAYVGTWTYGTGSTLTPMNCMVLGTTIPALDLTGDTVTIGMGSDSSQVVFNEGTACSIKFTVNGTTATAGADQSCTIPVDGVSAVINISSWTLTLSGETLAASFSGSAPIGGASCTASGTGSLTKNATDAAASG